MDFSSNIKIDTEDILGAREFVWQFRCDVCNGCISDLSMFNLVESDKKKSGDSKWTEGFKLETTVECEECSQRYLVGYRIKFLTTGEIEQYKYTVNAFLISVDEAGEPILKKMTKENNNLWADIRNSTSLL